MSTPVNMALESAKRVKQGSGFSFPDDLVIHILSSLPAEEVLRCRRVCRRWRYLISTQYFVHTHSRRSAPMVVGTGVAINHGFKRFLLSRWWEPVPTKSVICILNKFPESIGESPYMWSGDGLLISKVYRSAKFVVFSPVDGKEVTIDMPSLMFWRTEPLAIYFHPTLKEHCILWIVRLPSGCCPDRCMILNLGSKPCWKTISNPWIHLSEDPKIFEDPTISRKSTVSVGGYLYWLVEPPDVDVDFAIVEFDILREEPKVMFSPVSTAVKYYGYSEHLLHNRSVNLVDAGGLLSLFLISPTENRIYQWTLKSREEELWTSCIHNITEGHQLYNGHYRPVALVEEHLLITSFRDILVANLKLGTIRKLGQNYFSPYAKLEYHVISLASLRNCKSKIVIDEKDDNWRWLRYARKRSHHFK